MEIRVSTLLSERGVKPLRGKEVAVNVGSGALWSIEKAMINESSTT
jgi:hypothetical protein